MTTASAPLIKPLPGLADYGLLLTLAALWGSAFVVTEYGIRTLSPVLLTLARLIVASLFLWAIVLVRRPSITKSPRDWALMILAGVIGNSVPFVLISWGQEGADANVAAILMGVMPLLTLVFAHIFTQDEKLKKHQLTGVTCGFIGLIVLIGPANIFKLGDGVVHQLAIALAAASYAFNSVLVKLIIHVDKLLLSVIGITMGGFALLPFVDFSEIATVTWTSDVLIPPILLGLFHTAIAALLLAVVIKRQGAGFFAQVNLLVPLFGVVWAFIILGEKPQLSALLALVIILSGIVIARGPRNADHQKS